MKTLMTECRSSEDDIRAQLISWNLYENNRPRLTTGNRNLISKKNQTREFYILDTINLISSILYTTIHIIVESLKFLRLIIFELQ